MLSLVDIGPFRMSSLSPYLPARYYALMCDWLRAKGTDVDRLLRAARVQPGEIHGPDAALTLEQAEALVDQVIQQTGRSDLGFELGRLIKLSSHDILGYAIISSPTVDYALSLASRYYRLITALFTMRYRRGPLRAELEFRPAMPLSPQALAFHMETIAVSTHEQIKSLLGVRLGSYDVHMSCPEPTHARRYRELAPAIFHFGSEAMTGVRFVLPTAMTTLPLAMADRGALQMAESRCEALLQHVRQVGCLSDWIVMMLREAHEGFPTLDELAHILHLSSRTLDRHLRKEGHRFLDLSKKVRHEKACELLRSGGLSVTQIAYQLGYNDVANFTRAFRRDAGISPSRFQSAQGAEPTDAAVAYAQAPQNAPRSAARRR